VAEPAEIPSATAYVNFTEFEGDTLEMAFTWKDSLGDVVPLSAYTARMEIRKTVVDPDILLALTESSGIVLQDVAFSITATVTDAQTAALGFGGYVYDIQLTDTTGKVNTLIAGTITLEPSVTKPAA